MVTKRKNTLLRLRRTLAFIMCLIMIIGSTSVYIDYRLQSVVKSFAKSEIKTVLINCTSRAGARVLADMKVSYSDLAVINRDADGRVTSVEINSVEANRFKAEMNSAIAKEVASYRNVEFDVPLFAVFGVYRTHFKQPKLSYSVQVTTTIGTNFKSNFKEAGINQVLHQILLTVSMESDLAMLSDNTELKTLTEFIVAETVIVGAVPDAFTEVIGVSDEISEDIFDFGAAAP